MDALVAYGVNRRFMLEVVGNYEWENARTGGSMFPELALH